MEKFREPRASITFSARNGFALKKMFRMVRFTLFCFFLSLIQVMALDSYSQQTRISLNQHDQRLEEVLKTIEDKSEFFFLYNRDLINVNQKVNINVSNQTINGILDELLKGTDISYAVVNRQIILSNLEGNSGLVSQQQKSVSGKVTDSSGSGLPGVSVVIKGTITGVITDMDGKYTILKVPEKDAILQFSFVGMKRQEIAIEDKTVINVMLSEEAIGIDEVVAIGYGTQQKREVSGSISTVSEKNFNKGVSQNAFDLLKGRVSGLSITSGSGDVTSEQVIRLRGTSSLSGSSQPFIVIDGVPGMSLSSVAPQDIESISVLKDASAAAIYGSRSAGGVIIVTTKQGKNNQSIVEYDGYLAMSNVTNIPDVLTANEWRDYTIKNNLNTEGLDRGANTDWFNAIMRKGISQNHNISLSGGGTSSNYRASISYLNQEGVVKDNQSEQYNARLTFNQKALNNLLNLTFTGAMTIRDYSPTDTRNFVLAYNMIPVVPIKNSDGSWFDTQDFDQGNPVRNIELNSSLNKNSIFFGNMNAELNLFKGFTAGLKLHKQRNTNDYGLYYNSQDERGRAELGYGTRQNWTSDKELLEATFNYEKQINNHKLNFLGGYSYEDNYYQNAGAQNRQFVTDYFGYNNLGVGENLQPSDVWSGKKMNKLVSFFGRINYNYLMRYILTLSIRNDGSSKFGANHKWATFPSISAAWRINEESFLKSATYLDELKIRVGYGVSGNQDGIEPYQSLELYGSSEQYYDNGKWYSAYQISQNANPNLKWEQTSMFNIGLDYSFLKNRINGTIEYYDKRTKDLLYTYQVPVPPYLFPTMLANVGSMSNKGIELMISGDIVRKNNLRWTASLNLAHNNNIITSLSNEAFATTSIKTGDRDIRGSDHITTHVIEEGRKVGTFYGWVYKGLDKDGQFILDDMIDGKPGLTDLDRTYIGCAQPKIIYGLSNTITYKNWEANLFFRGVYGNDILNLPKMVFGTKQWLPGANVLHAALNNGVNDNPKYSSYYIEKGSFLRLDNLSIAYNFKTNDYLGIKKFRVYLTGQNIFTITKYSGLDPEVDLDGLSPGVEDSNYYPKSRTFSLGINLTF